MPGQIVSREKDEALVDFQGNRLKVNMILTPEAKAGGWVLVHAGFAISEIEEQDALETWSYLKACYEQDPSALAEG